MLEVLGVLFLWMIVGPIVGLAFLVIVCSWAIRASGDGITKGKNNERK